MSRAPLRIVLFTLISASCSFALAQEADSASREEEYQQLLQEVAPLEKQFNALKRVVKFVKPAVVHIDAEKRDESARRGKVEEAGSGVIITYRSRFFVITNRHVVLDSELNEIHVKLDDGRVLHPSRVVGDPESDVAVMEIAAPRLITAKLGDSSKIEAGDFVLAMGSPFGLSHSVTFGMISAVGRRDLQLGGASLRYQDFFQTDAAINPGNSGGPLINLRGEIVGINTAIASNSGGNEGIGFSIPVNMVKIIVQQLIDDGRVTRAFLGVTLDSRFTSEVARRKGLPLLMGAHVVAITPNSPAEAANIQEGDVILKFNDVLIEDDDHLVNQVGLTPVRTPISTTILRNGKQIEMNVTVQPRPVR